MKTPEQIALDILDGDNRAKEELEKMFGKSVEEMTVEERRLGVACLSVFDGNW